MMKSNLEDRKKFEKKNPLTYSVDFLDRRRGLNGPSPGFSSIGQKLFNKSSKKFCDLKCYYIGYLSKLTIQVQAFFLAMETIYYNLT